jgi:hypothetical protein
MTARASHGRRHVAVRPYGGVAAPSGAHAEAGVNRPLAIGLLLALTRPSAAG